ncbi:MAG: TatD family hydrolase, partial [Tepidiformaceae bacterium]
DTAGPGWPVQRACFIAQAGLARGLELALILHIDGEGAWAQLLASATALDGVCVVRHYFRGDNAQAQWHAARGHYLSFGRPLLRDTGLQAIAAAYPAELLLIETDTYPVPGRTTEPKDLVPVGELLAQLRGWSVQACADRLWQNSFSALGLDEAQAAPVSD